MSDKDPYVYLAHAKDCAQQVILYATEGRKQFLEDRKTQDAILRNLEILGQCLKDAGVEFLEAADGSIEWRKVAAFRNVLAHAYISVRPERVWIIVEDELPAVFDALQRMLATRFQ